MRPSVAPRAQAAHPPSVPQEGSLREHWERGINVPLAKTIPRPAPLGALFARLRNRPGAFLLDSARFHRETGAYSFFGCEPFLTAVGWPSGLAVHQGRASTFKKGNPLDLFEALLSLWPVRPAAHLPPFQGGAVVLLGYELAGAIEPRLSFLDPPCGEPLMRAFFYDTVAAVDHAAQCLFLMSWIRADEPPWENALLRARERMKKLEAHLLKPLPAAGPFWARNLSSNFSCEAFERMVRRAKAYLKAGDMYQANLSQRFSFRWSGDPWKLYENLRRINPSPFAAYVNHGDGVVVSASPERLVRLRGRVAETRPIAGTRPAGRSAKDTASYAKDLFLSHKERAEHLMLLDLERNDLGRVSRFQSVRVSEMMTLERYSHVQHIVSNVRGELCAEKNEVDLLRALFPGGTITGCPKIRCMEVIRELERIPRGLYTGSLGYLAAGGDLDLSILIRTFFLKPGFGTFQVGAGIVMDSDPRAEYEETLHKGEALAKAFGAHLL